MELQIRRLSPSDAPAYRALRLRGIIGRALLVLTVTGGNQGATTLYERAGFHSFGVEPDAIRVDGRSFAKRHMFIELTPA